MNKIDKIERDGIVLWTYNETNELHCAWTNNGQTKWFIRDDEKNISPETYANMMIEKTRNGIRRCSTCGKEMQEKDVAGYPLFAGINCSDCWEKHQEKIEQERKNGDVCRICGKPYSLCYC